jgi:serine/threonine protein kinase/WD40 repeat protein/Flp pilus assembly protein TadD
MSEISPGSGRDSVEQLLESFLARWRRGERPSPEEYAAQCPERADEIRELFPALVEMEQLKPAVEAASGLVAPPSAPPHPERLGDYRILRVIGEGGMGVVYEAEHESLKNRVALKVMHARLRAERTYLRRFQTEARSAARLHHTNIVPVFDFGEQNGTCYYAMQFIAGVGLNAVLDDVRRVRATPDGVSQAGTGGNGNDQATEPVDGPLSAVTHGLLTGRFATAPATPGGSNPAPTVSLDPDRTEPAAFMVVPDRPAAAPSAAVPEVGRPSVGRAAGSGDPRRTIGGSGSNSFAGQPESIYFREIARIGAQVADALDYAHGQGVVHRDIKPSNLMLDAQGNVWVTDFGLAKLVEGEDLSQSHDLVGTLRFMAPERFRGVTDRRSDVYALGATLYEMLALRPAFPQRDQVQLVDQIAHQAPTPLRQHDSRIPRDLETIVLKVLAKDPKDRCEQAGELRDELRRLLEGRPTRWRRVGPVEQFRRWCKRNPWLAVANIMAAVLTTVLAIGSTIAAWIYSDQVDALQLEQRRTKLAQQGLVAQLAQTRKARQKAQLALGQSLRSEGAALQRSGLIGQRFESLERLDRAAKLLRDDPEGRDRLPELRDHAIAAMGLSDLRVRWERKIGVVMDGACDVALERYAIVELHSGQIVVRRLDDDRELVRLPRPEVSFWHAQPGFSPDGKHLWVRCFTNGGDTVWDVWHLGRRERVFHQRSRSHGCAFHPDGRRLVFAPLGKDLIVWDLVERWEVKRLPLDFQPAGLRLDAEGRRIAANAAAAPFRIHILDLDTGQALASWTDQVGNSAMSWSRDDRLLATGHGDGRVFVWDVERGRLASVLQGHTSNVIRCQFAPESHLLATDSWDGTSRLWNASTGESLATVPSLHFMGFSPDGRRAAFSNGPMLRVWDVAHGQEVSTLNPLVIGNRTEVTPLDEVRAARFSPDNRLAALAAGTGVNLYDVASGRELAYLDAGSGNSVLFDQVGRSLISYSDRGLFRWPIRPGPDGGAETLRVGPPELLQETTAGSGGKASWLPDHRTLAAMDNVNARVLLVDTAHPHPAIRRCRALSSGPNHRMTSLAVSPDGRWAAAGGWKERGIYVWDLPRLRLERILPPSDSEGNNETSVAFSPDGRWLVSCSQNVAASGYYFWEVGTWKRGPFIRPDSSLLSWGEPVFSPDGRLVALSRSLHQIRLAETATGRAVAHLPTLQPLAALPLAFSPDGTKLIARTNRKTALMWDLRRIREQLRTMDLDWDQPPFPPERDASAAARPPIRSIQVIGAVLEPSARRAAELAALDARLRGHPDDGDALIQRGWLRLRMAKGPEALADLERGFQLRPDDTDALFLLAEAHSQSNNLPATRSALEQYLARSPDDVDARLFHGQVALRLNLVTEAAEHFTRVLEADPGRDRVRFDRAQVSLRLGRFQDALTDLDELIPRYPQDARLYELRSRAHERLGHHDQARGDLKRASESPQASAMQLNNLAWQLATGPPGLRDPARALELAWNAASKAPDTAIYLNTLGVAQYRAGRFAEAVATLEKSLAAGKGQADAFDLFFLAMARSKLGQIARARADLDGAVQWRRDHHDLSAQWSAELDDFQAEAQALLDAPPFDLPANVFAPGPPIRP